jgi:spermidine/putrescine transport system substrate-binding protein
MPSSRRRFLAVAAAGLAMPALLRSSDALASSGAVNVLAFADYIPPESIAAFESATGIKVNLTAFGSNREAFDRVSKAGAAYDVVITSVTSGPPYYAAKLLRPLDEARLKLDRVIPSILRDSVQLGATSRGARMLVPYNWGTEGITFDSELFPVPDGEISYEMLWRPEAIGHLVVRLQSIVIGTAIYLDALGQVPSNRALDLFKSEADMRRVLDPVVGYVLARRDRIAGFWTNAADARQAFTANGRIGLTWDTTGLLLAREAPRWKYRLPKEGGLTWLDGVGITAAAQNVDQAYAFLDALLTPEVGGRMSATTGFNSAVVGAARFAGADYARQYGEVYTAETLQTLWWWQAESPWTQAVMLEYVEKISRA